MNHTGVVSTGSQRHARRNRSFTCVCYYWSAGCGSKGLGTSHLARVADEVAVVGSVAVAGSVSSGDSTSMLRCGFFVRRNPSPPSARPRGGCLTPIMVRPVREQFEHDRVIRLLQSRFRRRYAVASNVGDESTASVRVGTRVMYPDLTLTSTEGGRRLHGVVEVETTESMNHLEARAQWAHLGKVRGAFYLYVPAGEAEMARRLCADNQVAVTEIWSYHAVGDQMRFTMAHRASPPSRGGVRPGPAKKRSAAVRRPRAAAGRSTKSAKRPKSRAGARSSRRSPKPK